MKKTCSVAQLDSCNSVQKAKIQTFVLLGLNACITIFVSRATGANANNMRKGERWQAGA